MEKRGILPLNQIRSYTTFAVYSPREGLIAGGEEAAPSMRALAVHIRQNPKSDATIYQRTPEGWQRIL